MSLFGVQLNSQVNRIITEMRLVLQKHKLLPNLRTLYRSFAQFDIEVSGFIPPPLFEKALNQNGLFVKKVELTTLRKAFDNDKGLVNWFQFMHTLKIPINEQRRHFLQDIFDHLAKQHEWLTPQNLLQHFDPSEIELVKTGKLTVERAQHQLIALLPIPDGHLTKQEFVAFFDDLSTNFPHDQPFFKYVAHLWGHSPQRRQQPKEEDLRLVIKSLRFKLIQKSKGTKDEFLMRKLFDQYDENKNGFISPYELDLMLKQLQLPIAQELVEPLFRKLDRNNSGNIEYDEFKRFIFFDPYPA